MLIGLLLDGYYMLWCVCVGGGREWCASVHNDYAIKITFEYNIEKSMVENLQVLSPFDPEVCIARHKSLSSAM